MTKPEINDAGDVARKIDFIDDAFSITLEAPAAHYFY